MRAFDGSGSSMFHPETSALKLDLPHAFHSTSSSHSFFSQVATAAAIDDRPSCFRFPRGNGVGVDLTAEGIKDMKGTPLEVRVMDCVS